MAWTEQCKVAFEFGVRAKIKKGLNTTKALRELSGESEIPYHTLRDWYYNKEQSSRNSPTTPPTTVNNCETANKVEETTCSDCKVNPPRIGHLTCSSCQNKAHRAKRLKHLKALTTQVSSLKDSIVKEGMSKHKWLNGIRKNEYEQVINVLIETVKIWKEVSDGTKTKS